MILAKPRLVLASLAFLAALPQARAEERVLVFGVLNQQSPVQTAERWNPVLNYLGRKVGVPMRLKMGPTVERTNEMMAAGVFDLVFTNHNFKPEYDLLGLVTIARWGDRAVQAAIAVLADSPVARLEDLRGRRVAFPSLHAFLGYAVPSVALRAAGIDVEEVLAANQEGGLAQLKAGRVDAAAVNSRFLDAFVEREGVAVRRVYLSDPFPDLAVVAHPRLPAELRDRVRDALVGMRSDKDAAEMMARCGCPGFTAATDRDYDGVRSVYRQASR